MSAQVERLQALLQRVSDNRQKPRAAASIHIAGVPAAAAAPEPRLSAPAERAAPSRGVTAPVLQTAPYASPVPAPETRPKPKSPTPLELAVEGRISQPLPSPQAARPAPAAVSKAPAVSARPVQAGTLLVDGAPAEPSKPITHVVSTHPPFTAQSFGELLRRSLSLRPR